MIKLLPSSNKGEESLVEQEWNNKIVLVVEDDPKFRYMLAIRLISAGYTVYEAANGLEALEQMGKHPIDVVLTDCRMPKMDGLEFLSISSLRWPGVPVVIVSGERDDMVQEAIDRGAFAWVRKGAETATLLSVLAMAIPHSALFQRGSSAPSEIYLK
jgi:CheY-like chemotaxis protein